MIEMAILAMVFAVVVKRGAEDLIHTARGGTPPRRAASAQRRKSGAAGRYWGQLWDDSWTDLQTRHTEKRDRRNAAPRPVRDPGQWRTVFTQFGDDFGNWARATWRYGWNRHAARRQEKRLRDSAGRQTVPGTVVPNADERHAEPPVRSWIWRRVGWKCRICGSTQGVAEISFGEGFKRFNTRLRYCPKHMADYGPGGTKIDYGPDPSSVPGQDGAQDEDGDRPQDETEDRPVPEPSSVPAEDDAPVPPSRDEESVPSPTDLQDEDQSGPDSVPDYVPDFDPSPATPTTTEGPTMTTMPSTEIVGLEPAITFFEASAHAYTEQSVRIGDTLSALQGFGLSGPALADAASAMDMSQSCAASSARVASELRKHRAIPEAIDAVTGAADSMEFYKAGR